MSQLKWIEPSEKEIETAILEFLNYQAGCFAFKVNTMGVYDQRRKVYRKPNSKFIIRGTPDILACLNVQGLPIFMGLEVKSATGRQSDHQKDFEKRLKEKSEGFYFLVRSVKDAEDALHTVKEKVNVYFP